MEEIGEKATYAIKNAGGNIERKEGLICATKGRAKGEERAKRSAYGNNEGRIANGILGDIETLPY